MKLNLTASIVAYKNDPTRLGITINSYLKNTLNGKLIVVDNSPTPLLKSLVINTGGEYQFNGANLGFGEAHNLALRTILNTSKYHLVLNPDVSFEEGTLEKLYDYMENHLDVGLIMPKVLDDDGKLQFLCKRLPSPADLVLRRFLAPYLKNQFNKTQYFYEMHDKDYNTIFEAPCLSGCFMFLRVEALKKVGLFDERFFMYMEDIDLSRRIAMYFKNIYYPDAQIRHGHARDSYRNRLLLKVHATSAIKYFTKWGWILDEERERINKTV